MKENLFALHKHQISGPKPYSISLYEYLSRSDKEIATKLRESWEKTFRACRLAKNIKKDIMGRFTSTENDQHLSAVFELFLYDFFHNIDCKLGGHPKLAGGRPDYKVIVPNNNNFYLEATCQVGPLKKENEQYWKDMISDAITDIHSGYFRVAVSFRGSLNHQPDVKSIRRQIEYWLSKLDYHNLLAKLKKERDVQKMPLKTFNASGLQILLYPYPIHPPKSSRRHGLIMIGSYGGLKRVVTGDRIEKKLIDKKRQLKGSKIPSIIAVNVLDDFFDNDEILKSLFGALHSNVSLRNRLPVKIIPSRGPTGFWNYKGKPTNQRISAIMFFYQLAIFRIPQQKPKIILNPFIENNKTPRNLKHFDYYKPFENGLKLVPLGHVSNSLDNSWLQEWPFKKMY